MQNESRFVAYIGNRKSREIDLSVSVFNAKDSVKLIPFCHYIHTGNCNYISCLHIFKTKSRLCSVVVNLILQSRFRVLSVKSECFSANWID